MPLLILGFKGFKHRDFQAEIRSELDRLGDNDLVRVIDAVGVCKSFDSEVEVLHNSQLGADQQAAFGALVGGLLVVGAARGGGFELGAERGAEAVAERERVASGWPRSSSAHSAPVAAAAAALMASRRWGSGRHIGWPAAASDAPGPSKNPD